MNLGKTILGLLLAPLNIVFLFTGVITGVVLLGVAAVSIISILIAVLGLLAAAIGVALIPGIPFSVALAGSWAIEQISDKVFDEESDSSDE